MYYIWLDIEKCIEFFVRIIKEENNKIRIGERNNIKEN